MPAQWYDTIKSTDQSKIENPTFVWANEPAKSHLLSYYSSAEAQLAASLRSRDGCEALSNVSVWLQALEVKCMEFIPESVSVCLKLRQLQWNVVIET